MAKKQTIPYREYEAELNRRIEQQDFPPVTLICGEQDYLRAQCTERLRAAILGEGNAMNSTVLRGSAVTASQVIDMAETMPFFAPRRVIVVEESSFFARPGEEAERIAAYLERMPQTSFLIFAEPSPNATYKLYKAIAKRGFICRCDTPDERWIRDYAGGLFSEAGLAISGSVLNRFLQGTGTDLLRIRSESEKLIGYCLERGRVTQADVDEIGSPVTQDRIFDMISAISGGQRDLALSIYMDLRKLQTPPQVILSLMIRQYTQLLQAGELLQTMSDREAAAALKVSPWVMSNKLRPALRGHTQRGLENALAACVKSDYDYKCGRISPELAVEELIVVLSGRRGG